MGNVFHLNLVSVRVFIRASFNSLIKTVQNYSNDVTVVVISVDINLLH